MIKRLRRNFILIMMSIVAAILLAVFLAVLFTTQRNLDRTGTVALHQAIREQPEPWNENRGGDGPPSGFDGGFENGGPVPSGGRDRPQRTATLTVQLGDPGYEVIRNRIHFLEEAEIGALVAEAAAREEPTGVLETQNLRYLREETPEGTRIAFVDTYLERDMLRAMVRNSLAIGAGALLLFFLLSLFLARWAVRPVQLAWDRQRRFVADASHELKTPLTVILSNADMLRTGGEPERSGRRLENIHAEGLRMKRLIEELLTLARTDGAGAAPVFSRVDWSDTVTESLLSFESAIYDDGKHLHYRVEEKITVQGDPARLRQLTDILLDNARKYCPPGGHIEVCLEQAGRGSGRLTVQNEGESLPPGELEAIFERFYRLDKARANHGGFGLGLAIARSVVEEHHGRIWAESDAERGNVFVVVL